MIFILNTSGQVIGTLARYGTTNKVTPYFDDKHVVDLSTGAETFTFSTFANTKESTQVVGGNFVAFQEGNGYKLFQISEVTEEHTDEHIKTAYCEMAGIELINEILRATTLSSASIEQALTFALQDTEYQVGNIDASLVDVHTIELKDPIKAYNFIQQYIIGLYGAEISYRVEIKGGRIVGKYIDCYAERGDFKGIRFEYGKSINKVKKVADFTELATALVCQGKNGTTISSVEAPDKPAGQDWIGDEEAYQLYNKNGSHIFDVFKYDTESPAELLLEARKELANRCKPKLKYEVDVELLGTELNIGDTIYVVDNEFLPPLHLSARVSQIQKHRTDPSKDKVILSNYKEVVSKITDEDRDLASLIDERFPIGSSDIKDGAVTSSKIPSNAVQSTHIKEDTITTDHLKAKSITSDKIEAGQIKAEHILTDQIKTEHLKAESIDASKIKAGSIETQHLKADIIESTHIKADQIQSQHIESNTITTDHLQANIINSNHIQAGSITAGSGIISEGAIGSAQISSLEASKIDAGTIDTSRVTIAGTNGHLKLKGNRLQVFDGLGNKAVERVSVGDVNGDGTRYGLRVRGADGETVLLDENGVTREGITDGSITNDKISDNAGIDGAKLNINSVVSCINKDGTEVIKGTKISVNGTNLETKLSSIETTQSTQGSTISQHSSKILANEKAIALKVDSQTYTTDKNNMTTQLNKNTSAIDVLQDEIALKVEQTDITNAINGVQVGGRNLALNTSTPLTLTNFTGASNYCTREYKVPIKGLELNDRLTISYDFEYTNLTKGSSASIYLHGWGKTSGWSNGVNIRDNFNTGNVTWGTTTKKTIRQKSYMIVNSITLTDSEIYLRVRTDGITGGSFTIKNFKIEKGSKATDWTPAPEDITSEIDTKINSAKAEIKVTTDAITQNVSNLSQTVSNKADGSTVSTLSNKVGSLETSVNGISGKVSNLETSNTTLNNKVNTAQNTANANKNNISSLQTEVSTVKNNVASLDVTTSGISQKVSSLQSTTTTLTNKVNTAQNTADNVNSKIDGLQVGGRNLAQSTSNNYSNAYSSFSGVTNTCPYLAKVLTDGLSVGDTVTVRLVYKYTNIVATSGQTASAWIQGSGNVTEWNSGSFRGSPRKTLSGSGEHTFLYSFTITENHLKNTYWSTYIRHDYVQSGSVQWKLYKVEKGNKATDWTPAPEDVSQDATNKSNQALTDAKNYTNTQITTVNNKVASIQTDLNGITSRVTNTENRINTINGNVTSLTNRVTTTESKITDTAITNTVKKNFYTKSETESAITSKGYQTSSQVQQTVNGLQVKVSNSGGYNLIRNSTGASGNTSGWTYSGTSMGVGRNNSIGSSNTTYMYLNNGTTTSERYAFSSRFKLKPSTTYRFTGYFHNYTSCPSFDVYVLVSTTLEETDTSTSYDVVRQVINTQNTNGNWKKYSVTFTTPANTKSGYIRIDNNGYNSSGTNDNNIHWNSLILTEGELEVPWSPHPSEVYDGITTIDKDGITVSNSSSSTHTQIDSSSFRVENNTGGTVAEFSQNSQIPNLTAGTITANNVYASNICSKSPKAGDIKFIYVNGSTGNDNGAGTSSSPYKTVQRAIDDIKDKQDQSVTIYVYNSVPGFDLKGITGTGVITLSLQDSAVINGAVILGGVTNSIRITNETGSRKATLKNGISIFRCVNVDIYGITFRGTNAQGNNIYIQDTNYCAVNNCDLGGLSTKLLCAIDVRSSLLWLHGCIGSNITDVVAQYAFSHVMMARAGTSNVPDYSNTLLCNYDGGARIQNWTGGSYTKTPSSGWNPAYTPTQKTQTWSFNNIWSDETLHGWSDRQELIQGYSSTWNTGRWTGYIQMSDSMAGIRSTISGGTNLSGRIYIQRTSSSGNSTGSKLCLYASDGTLITNSTTINRSQGVWVSLSSSIIQKIQSGAITYFYLKADSNNSATYFKCERNCKIEITYTK